MAQTIARKIVDNPSVFPEPEIRGLAKGMLEAVYWTAWVNFPKEWDQDDTEINFWPRMKKHLPEILERIKLLDSGGRP